MKGVGEHTIYIEKVKKGEKVPCQTHGIKEKPDRTCMGYADLPGVEDLKDAMLDVRTAIQLDGFEKLFISKKISDHEFDILLKDLLTKYKKLEEAKQVYKGHPEINEKMKSLDLKGLRKAGDWLLQARENGDSYQAIFANRDEFRLDNKVSEATHKKIKDANHKRNKALLYTLNQHQGHGVVVAGAAHVDENIMPEDDGDASYVQEELRKGPHQNYYAVLAMRQDV